MQHEAAQARAHASLERGRPVRLAAPASAAATRRLALLAASLQARALRPAQRTPPMAMLRLHPLSLRIPRCTYPKYAFPLLHRTSKALLRHHFLSLAPRMPPARACADLARSKGRQHCRAALG